MMERYFTQKQIQEEWDISRSTVQRLMKEGLRHIKIRGKVLFTKVDVEEFIKNRTINKTNGNDNTT